MGYTLLFEGNAPSTCEESSMKEKIIKKLVIISIIKNTHLEGCTRQFCLVLIHLLQGIVPPIFTAVPLQYFPGCFSLAFLESYCHSSSLAVISLCLDHATWDPLVSSNRAASFLSTLSWSHWMYSNFFFFSTILHFLVFSLVLASTSLLAF